MNTQVTALEMQLLYDIGFSDYSSDGHGLTTWVEEWNFSLPMRQVRALMTTLTAKGIIAVTQPEYGMPGCVFIREEYQIRAHIHKDEKRQKLINCTGYDFTNLEVRE